MADGPTKVKTTLYNIGEGPRSVALGDGTTRVIPAGGEADVEVFQGELDDLHPDLSEDKPKPEGSGRRARAERAPAAGSTNTDQTADEKARAIEELATQLEQGHSLEELQKVAKNEKAKAEGGDDATAAQLALAIAQKRLGANE